MRYSTRTRPCPGFFISIISPRRGPSFSITAPRYSSGTSMASSSYGSSLSPLRPVLRITRGRDTWNSYPSRRIVSIRMERCSSPRPLTVHVSVESVSSTLRATLRSSSLYSRSRSCREVTNFPSLPAKGELLTRKSTLIVGSSTAMPSSRSGCSTSVTVSPISTPSSPASETISPAGALWTSVRSSPSYTYSLVTRACSFF